MGKIARWVVGGLLSLYLLLLIIFNFSPADRWVSRLVSQQLSDRLHTQVKIGGVRLGLFNRLILTDVYLADQRGKELLRADLMSAKIEFRSLFQGRVSLRTVSLLDAQINLYKESPDKAPNFQFLLDAFRSKDQSPSNLDLRINSLILRRCKASYHALYAPRSPEKLNLNHLVVSDINANVSLKHLTPDSINIRVRELSLREQSGLNLRRLSLRLAANKTRADIQDFDLQLPGTKIGFPRLLAFYKPDNFFKTLYLAGRIDNAQFTTTDFGFLVPRLRGFAHTLTARGLFAVNAKEIVLENWYVHEEHNNLLLALSGKLSRRNGRIVSADANIKTLNLREGLISQAFLHFLRRPLPAFLKTLVYVDYTGRLHWEEGGINRAAGTLKTAVGSVEGRLAFNGHYEGNLKVKALRPTIIAQNQDLPDQLYATLLGSMARDGSKADLKLALESGQYRGHFYNNLQATINKRNDDLQLQLTAKDPAADLNGTVQARLRGANLEAIRLEADVKQLNPGRLNLTRYFGASSFSGHVKMAVDDLKQLTGHIKVNDFTLSGTDSPYRLNQLELSKQYNRLDLKSDFADLLVEGPIAPATIKQLLFSLLDRSLPGFFSKPIASPRTTLAFKGQVKKTDVLNRFLHIPLYAEKGIKIEGKLSSSARSSVIISAPTLSYNNFALSDLRFYLQGEGTRYTGLAQAAKEVGNTQMRVALETKTDSGKLHTHLAWAGTDEHEFKGDMKLISTFKQTSRGRLIRTDFVPTTMTVGDTLWTFSKGELAYVDRTLDVKGFSLQHGDRSLSISGRLSPSPKDSIVATLQKVNVDYILNLVNFNDVAFAGPATGTLSVSETAGYPIVSVGLKIPRFLINNGPMGTAYIRGGFDTKQKQINIDAHILNPEEGVTDVKGYVSLLHKNLDLFIKGTGTDLRFLRRWVGDIFNDLRGKATGHVRLFGPLKQLDLEGEEEAELEAQIAATGAHYKVDGGRVVIRPGLFSFNEIPISDGEKGKGVAQGYLRHNHLHNLTYDFNISAENLLVYKRSQSADLPFYATAYGSGSAHLSGRPGLFEADLDMRTEEGTTLTYTADAPEKGDNALLRLHNGKDSLVKQGAVAGIKSMTQPTDIKLNFLFDVRPEATLKIVTDEKAGNVLTLHGSGPIRANWYNKGAFKMYGTYKIDGGSYRISVQDLIRKNFTLTPGSKMIFAGDPFQGDLDMQAVYTVKSASLSDLNIGNNFSRNTVRVNCLLNIKGKAGNPQVSFDLDLPTVNEDEKQMVRNLISSEEDMNMQVLYLLSIGRFYTYDYDQTNAGTRQTQSTAAMKSFLSNTLSDQLNNVLQNAIGNSNWSFGANVQTGLVGWQDMEVEGLLSGRLLNNRLIINGNFGYRDKPINNTNFIGDFDLRYLLTPGGGVSLKAYSETNDRYYTKSSLTTQGVGLLLQRDFIDFRDLLKLRKKKNHKQQQPLPKQEEAPVLINFRRRSVW